ncbi:MAG: protein kinase, partial [Cyanobacteriota bacterium]|nr:protein kinase [Cyanobacteriota bacterium]
DHRVLCDHCGQENFPDELATPATCWNCYMALTQPQTLRLTNGVVAASADNELCPHHFDNLKPPDLKHPVGLVVQHPSDPSMLGLKNLTTEPWTAILSNGSKTTVEAGKTCNLAAVIQLFTPMGDVITTI